MQFILAQGVVRKKKALEQELWDLSLNGMSCDRALAKSGVSEWWAFCGACIVTVVGRKLLTSPVELASSARFETTHGSVFNPIFQTRSLLGGLAGRKCAANCSLWA